LEVLLSVQPDSYGWIFGWLRSRSAWGTDENTTIYPLAASFTALLGSLFDRPNREGYDYWHRPGLAHLVRKPEF
jgi:hypothetical protein